MSIVDSSPSPVSQRRDAAWSSLYRIGGWSGILFAGPYLGAIVLLVIAPPPVNPSGAETLEYVAAHRWLYGTEQVLWLAPGLLAMIVLLAVSVALRRLDHGYVAMAGLVGVSSWALSLALPVTGGGAPLLVYLSNGYMATTSPERRTAYATVAEGLIAENNTPNLVGVLTTVGILFMSLVMTKGVFPRWIAYLGIATGGIGFASELLRPVLGIAYSIYGVLLLVWFGAVGWHLRSLSRVPAGGPFTP